MEYFPDNLARLLGLHRVKGGEAAEWLGMQQSSLSHWMAGKRQPTWASLTKVAEFFDVRPDSLVGLPFKDLLEREIANGDRFENVERKIQRARRGLEVVRS